MNESINLQQLERKAYLSYHQDGVIDIFIGSAIVTFGLFLLPWVVEYLWMAFSSLSIIWVLIYAGVKRAFTVPRIGYVEFKKHRRSRVMLIAVLLFIINLVFFLIQALGLLTPELRIFLNVYGFMVLAFVVGGLFFLIGFLTELHRVMGYGVVAIAVFLPLQFYPMHFSYSIILLGLVMTAYGCVLLFRFIRKYPKENSGVEHEDPWEEPTD
ncbi:MAG: hypothetical protein Q6364_12815 [Candidatus Hermodarchaeota archaeon]|nr:hypothetical protein [Candidatus Hermodarchaeota archaeon]